MFFIANIYICNVFSIQGKWNVFILCCLLCFSCFNSWLALLLNTSIVCFVKAVPGMFSPGWLTKKELTFVICFHLKYRWQFFLLMNDTMISFVIWILGLILAVKAAQEIWKLNVDTVKKVLAIVLVLITSWLGLAFYYFYGRDKLEEWLLWFAFI